MDSLSGFTALHLAVIGQHDKTIKILITNGANKNKLNKIMEKPIDCLSSNCNSNKKKYIYTLFGIKDDNDDDNASNNNNSEK